MSSGVILIATPFRLITNTEILLNMDNLTLVALQEAVASKYAAVRRLTRLESLGGKVFPPTYEGGEYADEQRQVRGEDGRVETVETVLLDSVQSQANRMETA